MDLLAQLQAVWPLVMEAPWGFTAVALALLAIGWGLGRFMYGERIALLKSRIEARDERLRDLQDKANTNGSAASEAEARGALLEYLSAHYRRTHKELSPRLAAGLELPPADWINAELAKLDEDWRVKNVRGNECDTYKPAVWG